MDQAHFIAMWKSLYDIFIQHKNEQEAYHSIVEVGTLLITLGDAGKFHTNSMDPLEVSQQFSVGKSKNGDSKEEAASSSTARPTSLKLPHSNAVDGKGKGDGSFLTKVNLKSYILQIVSCMSNPIIYVILFSVL